MDFVVVFFLVSVFVSVDLPVVAVSVVAVSVVAVPVVAVSVVPEAEVPVEAVAVSVVAASVVVDARTWSACYWEKREPGHVPARLSTSASRTKASPWDPHGQAEATVPSNSTVNKNVKMKDRIVNVVGAALVVEESRSGTAGVREILWAGKRAESITPCSEPPMWSHERLLTENNEVYRGLRTSTSAPLVRSWRAGKTLSGL